MTHQRQVWRREFCSACRSEGTFLSMPAFASPLYENNYWLSRHVKKQQQQQQKTTVNRVLFHSGNYFISMCLHTLSIFLPKATLLWRLPKRIPWWRIQWHMYPLFQTHSATQVCISMSWNNFYSRSDKMINSFKFWKENPSFQGVLLLLLFCFDIFCLLNKTCFEKTSSLNDWVCWMNRFLPNKYEHLETYHQKVFCGTFSKTGDIFLSACQGTGNWFFVNLCVGVVFVVVCVCVCVGVCVHVHVFVLCSWTCMFGTVCMKTGL